MYPRNHAGFSGIDPILCLLAGICGIVVGLAIGGLLIIGRLPIYAVQFLKRKRDDAVAAATEATATVTQASDEESTPSRASLGNADRVKQFQIGTLAKVQCRFYSEDDLVTRHVFFLSQDAVAKAGKRIDLDPLRASEIDVSQLEQTTVQEVHALLGLAGSGPSGNLAENEATGDPVEVASQAEAVPASKPKAPKVRAERQRMASYQGVLLSACVQTRKSANPPYDAFCLTFDDEALGAEHQLWGADLERAIEESGAHMGDRVRVELVGETPTVVKGKTVTKKIWQVTKI